jgi:hypothetical protein
VGLAAGVKVNGRDRIRVSSAGCDGSARRGCSQRSRRGSRLGFFGPKSAMAHQRSFGTSVAMADRICGCSDPKGAVAAEPNRS